MASDLTTFQKYHFILQEFDKRQDKTLNGYDPVLQDELKLSSKQIVRLLRELASIYDNIVKVEGAKKESYKLIRPLDLFVEAFDKSDELGWLFHLAHEADPEIFKELEKFTNTNANLYRFKNTPFEDINAIESKQSFQRLKRIIEARDYAKITFLNGEIFDNLRCLQLLFMDNNWYVAYVLEDDSLRLGRISFIQRVDYGQKSGHFQLKPLNKQLNFLETVQNSMTLYGVEKKIATIKANPNIAHYFDKGMKIFLNSQKFQEKKEDGSVIFTLEYTQELEILPFIQKWLSDLIILKPIELRNSYLQKLQSAINNHK